MQSDQNCSVIHNSTVTKKCKDNFSDYVKRGQFTAISNQVLVAEWANDLAKYSLWSQTKLTAKQNNNLLHCKAPSIEI